MHVLDSSQMQVHLGKTISPGNFSYPCSVVETIVQYSVVSSVMPVGSYGLAAEV
jgi:hypothetical protein